MRRALSRTTSAWLVGFFFLSLSTAADDAPRGDLAKFQGVWTGKLGPAEDIPVTYTFAGDAVTIQLRIAGANSRSVTLHGKVRLDEAAKPHKSVDWLALTDPTGKSLPDQPGLYAFVGDDVLKICNGRAGLPRPTTLSDGPPTFVLTRARNAPADGNAKK